MTSPSSPTSTSSPPSPRAARIAAFIAGPLIAAIMLAAGARAGMPEAAWRTAAVGLWMIVWWMTEAAPIAATALLPIVLLPLFGVSSVNAATAPYANPVIFLFFGGFILAAAFEKSGLHRRLALALLGAVGTRPDRIIAGFMIAAGVISMWVSNTATVLMLLPLVNSMLAHRKPGTSHPEPLASHPEPLTSHPEPLASHPEPLASHPERSEGSAVVRGRLREGSAVVRGRLRERSSGGSADSSSHSRLGMTDAADFEKALLLGIAYAATIGGYGTLVGTPPNALLAGFLTQTHGITVSFLDYMMLGIPIVLVALPATWFLLTRVVFRVSGGAAAIGPDVVRVQRAALGPMTREETFVAVVGSLTALAWMSQPWLARAIPGVSEGGIGVACALVLLAWPMDRRWTRALTWNDAEKIPWGVLILFGGGLSLAGAIQDGGLAKWIGDSVGGLRALHPLLIIAVITTIITVLTEFTSNTATAAAFLPIAASLAVGVGMNPLVMAIAVGFAASNGFMMPVGTPPNAIVFGSGKLSIPEMARAGLLVDVVIIVLIIGVSYSLAVPVLGR